MRLVPAPDQVDAEIYSQLDFAFFVLQSFGSPGASVCVSRAARNTRGPGRWTWRRRAPKALEEGSPSRSPRGRGFYGPKIDIKIKDMLGRSWQRSTIQVDFNNPERFDATYVADDGTPRRAIMIHRALMGSLERFFGVLVEHLRGRLPVWLAPVQADVVPVTEKQNAFARDVVAALRAAGFRAEGDYRNEKLGSRPRVPGGQGAVRARRGRARSAKRKTFSAPARGELPLMPIEAFIERLRGDAVNRTE